MTKIIPYIESMTFNYYPLAIIDLIANVRDFKDHTEFMFTPEIVLM